MLSYVCLLTTPWTVAHQAFLLMEFPRREYWSGLPLPLSGDLPNPGIEPLSPGSLLRWRQILYCWATGEAPDLSDAISSYLYFHLTTMNLMNLLLLWVVISSFFILWFFFPSSCSKLWCARITSTMAQMVKNLTETHGVQSLGWEDPLKEGMTTHSSILAWRISWIEEPGRL